MGALHDPRREVKETTVQNEHLPGPAPRRLRINSRHAVDMKMVPHGEQAASQLPVLIIGAGTCGLALASGLKNAGIPYRVFERDASKDLRYGRDWALAMHWSAPALEKLIGPERWTHIAETQIDPFTPKKDVDVVKILNGKTGDTENELPFPNFYRLLRSRLREFLAQDLTVDYNRRLEQFQVNDKDGSTKTVTAYFDDGTSIEGRLLVGTDGAQSAVKNQLIPSPNSKPKRLPYAATFITASYTAEQALFLRSYHPLFTTILHPDSMLGMLATLDASDPDKPETWKFSFYISWRCSIEEQDAESARDGGRYDKKYRWKQVREKSKAFADPLKSAFSWLDEDMDNGHDERVGVYWGGVSNWDPSAEGHSWDNCGGLVTLAGDAAHPMTFHRGQGLNHAIADAAKLCELLSSPHDSSQPPSEATGGLSSQSASSQKTVIDIYEAEMQKRAGEEVRLSEMNTHMLHNWDKVQQSPLVKKGLAKS